MKKRLYFTLNGERYLILLNKTKSNSNYNIFGHVFKSGERTPLTGCTFKETDSSEHIKVVAIKSIQGWEDTQNDLLVSLTK